MGMRIFRIELNGFAKLGNGGFRKMADGIGAADENAQGGRITHGLLQMLEPLLGVGETLGFEVGDAKKIGSFEVVVEGDGGLEITNSGRKIAAVEVDAAEDVLSARVTWVFGDDGLGEFVSL